MLAHLLVQLRVLRRGERRERLVLAGGVGRERRRVHRVELLRGDGGEAGARPLELVRLRQSHDTPARGGLAGDQKDAARAASARAQVALEQRARLVDGQVGAAGVPPRRNRLLLAQHGVNLLEDAFHVGRL